MTGRRRRRKSYQTYDLRMANRHIAMKHWGAWIDLGLTVLCFVALVAWIYLSVS
jgi:hypothetical protein